MRYSKETLRNYKNMMTGLLNEYVNDIENQHVSFSQGNSKIGKVLNVSIISGLSCGNCSHCLPYCYDIKAALRFPEVKKARAKNSALAIHAREKYFAEIDNKMTRRKKNKFMRWHQGGEIVDYDYFCRMVENAKKHSDYECIWTYTKMHHIVNKYVAEHGNNRKIAIPENMVIMFSEWDGLPVINPYNFPVFTVRLKEGNKNHSDDYFKKLWCCPGNCDICKKAKRGCIAGETTYANEH